jgi:hypothetical protein
MARKDAAQTRPATRSTRPADRPAILHLRRPNAMSSRERVALSLLLKPDPKRER